MAGKVMKMYNKRVKGDGFSTPSSLQNRALRERYV